MFLSNREDVPRQPGFRSNGSRFPLLLAMLVLVVRNVFLSFSFKSIFTETESVTSSNETIPVVVENNKSRKNHLTLPPDDSPIPIFGRCPGGGPGGTVRYIRDKQEIIAKRNSTACTNSLDVLAWLMDQVNSRNETMMVTYGGLIHIHREHEFVRPDGSYIDDDFDTWVTPSSFQSISSREPEFWQKFGWTLRIFQNCKNHTLFGQLVSACGHEYREVVAKSKQDHPTAELYILQTLVNTSGIVRDLWQGGGNMPTKLIFPPQHLPFNSSGTNATLNLQIPRYSEKILTCIYGNWSVPSSMHAGVGSHVACMKKAASTIP